MPHPAEVYLHVGLHKTGTSTLQSQFDASRRQLQRHDVLYPRSLSGATAHHEIAWAFLKPWWANADYDPAAVLGHYRKTVNRARQARVVLSSEDINLLATTPAHIEAVRDAFAGHPITVVVYVRDVFSHMVSLYTHALAANREKRAFGPFVNQKKQASNYLPQLRGLAACFGRENLLIQPYEGDTVASFLRLLHLNIALRQQVARENTGLHPYFTQAALMVNRNPALSDAASKAIITAMRKIDPTPPPVDKVQHYWKPPIIEEHRKRLDRIRGKLLDEFGVDGYGDIDVDALMKKDRS